MILEFAIGDAYGAGFEFLGRSKEENDQFRLNDGVTYYPHGLNPQKQAGLYTDDTQMMIAVVEHLAAHRPLTREAFAESFFNAFKRDPRIGYSQAFYEVLMKSESPQELLANVGGKSIKNGAAMRALPCGFLGTIPEVLHAAEVQASVTHGSAAGILSAQAVALSAFALRTKASSLRELPDYLEGRIGWRPVHKLPLFYVAGYGLETVSAVFTVLLGNFDERPIRMSTLLTRAVGLGGDVDTVAALTLGLASLVDEQFGKLPLFVNDLPHALYEKLENGALGRDYLIALESKLDLIAQK